LPVQVILAIFRLIFLEDIKVAKKSPRVIITLECTEARKEGKSPSRYTMTKNKKTTPDRMELKKYNPFLRRHTIHKELK
jgi:large subunit ribosomal protein L33